MSHMELLHQVEAHELAEKKLGDGRLAVWAALCRRALGDVVFKVGKLLASSTNC